MSRIGERRNHAQDGPTAEYALKRAAIIAAAARVFHRCGYERASMSDIAAEAGTDRASAYYYFTGKPELFHAVVIDSVRDLAAAAERIAAAAGPAAQRVRLLLAELMAAYAARYPCLHVYAQEDMTRRAAADASAAALRQLDRRLSRAVEAIVADGVAAGEFRAALNPVLAARAILGVLNWSPRWLAPGNAAADDAAAAFTEIFLHGLLSDGGR